MTTFSQDALTAQQRARETALYAAYRMTIGDECLDACDVIDFAEYIRTGVRGLPVDMPRGADITGAWLDEMRIFRGGVKAPQAGTET